MQYTIRVSYQTGDSFGSEDTTDEVGIFNSIEEAQEACRYILEHHKFFKKLERWNISKEEAKKMIKIAKKSPWAVEEDYVSRDGINEYSVKYKEQNLHAFWMGYFERLHSLEVVPCGNKMIFYP